MVRDFAGALLFVLAACGVTHGDVPDGAANVPPADDGSAPPSSDASFLAETGDATSDGGPPLEAGPPPLTFDGPLQFDGPVSAVLHADGAWFVGGAFTRISSHAAPNFVHLQPSGEIGPCRLDVLAHSPLATSGEWIYLLKNAPGTTHGTLVKVRAATCAEDPTFHGPATGDVASGQVYTMVVAGGALYVGGVVPGFFGAPFLAKLDATTGAQDAAFGPSRSFTDTYPAGVYALAASDQALYVGGSFDAYRGTFVHGLAKVDLVTGALDATFDPPGSPPSGFSGGPVYALALAGTSLYVGGQFTDYRAAPGSAKGLAKLDGATGALDTTFSPPASNGFDSSGNPGAVYALLLAGGSLFAGGSFDAYRGQALAAPSLVKLDLITGALDPAFRPAAANGFGPPSARARMQWNPTQVFALAASETSLYVGGSFHTDDSTASDLAKLDLATGAVDESFMPTGGTTRGVSPSDSSFVTDRYSRYRFGVDNLVLANSTLWVAGHFAVYSGHRAIALAKLDDQTFALDTSFSPPPGSARNGFVNMYSFASGVSALASTDDALFVALTDDWLFTYRDTPLYGPVLKLDKRTAEPDPTFAGAADCDSVDALLVSGTSIYLAGNIAANHGTCVVKTDLTYGAHDPAFHWDGSKLWGWSLTALAASGTSLYVGGAFSYCPTGSDPCVPMNLAKVDTTTGALDTAFAPAGDAGAFDGTVSSLAVAGSSLYAAGSFTGYRGMADAAHRIAKLDPVTGALDTTFSPPGANGANGFDAPVQTLVVAGSSLFAGGAFSTYRGANVLAGIAKLDLATGAPDPSFGALDGGVGFKDPDYLSVSALGVTGTRLVAGGWFSSYGGTIALDWVTMDSRTGESR